MFANLRAMAALRSDVTDTWRITDQHISSIVMDRLMTTMAAQSLLTSAGPTTGHARPAMRVLTQATATPCFGCKSSCKTQRLAAP
jgi:hypothetical protein